MPGENVCSPNTSHLTWGRRVAGGGGGGDGAGGGGGVRSSLPSLLLIHSSGFLERLLSSAV